MATTQYITTSDTAELEDSERVEEYLDRFVREQELNIAIDDGRIAMWGFDSLDMYGGEESEFEADEHVENRVFGLIADCLAPGEVLDIRQVGNTKCRDAWAKRVIIRPGVARLGTLDDLDLRRPNLVEDDPCPAPDPAEHNTFRPEEFEFPV
jgi:hypothetical protein